MRQVYKAEDFVLRFRQANRSGILTWHEPVLIAVLFPFIRSKPWQLRSTPKMHEMGRELRKVLKDESVDAGNLLRQFWVNCLRLRTMPENVVRKMLYFGSLS